MRTTHTKINRSSKHPHLMQRFSIYLLRKPSSNPLCPKFCCHGNKGRSGKNSVGSIRWPNAHPRKPHYRRKHLANISYTDRVIVNFVPKFVAMETGVARREIKMTPSDSPAPKIGWCKQRAIIFYGGRVIANFVPKFVAMATGVGRRKI